MENFYLTVKLKVKKIVTNSDFLSTIRRYYRYEKSTLKFMKMRRAYYKTGYSVEIKKLEGIHEGKRCFIIGNGPSLKAEDLEKIKDEYSFAANRIYLIYDETEWRPTYYMCQDRQLIRSLADYYKTCKEKVILGYQAIYDYGIEVSGAYYYLHDSRNSNWIFEKIDFSDAADQVLYDGGSVSYSAIQMAVFMGFKEIYLLGMDHNFSHTLDKNRRIVKHNDVKEDYFDKRYTEAFKQFEQRGKVYAAPDKQLMNLAFDVAKRYCDKHEIKIYNATRGGKLEIFERVNFDEIVEE